MPDLQILTTKTIQIMAHLTREEIEKLIAVAAQPLYLKEADLSGINYQGFHLKRLTLRMRIL